MGVRDRVFVLVQRLVLRVSPSIVSRRIAKYSNASVRSLRQAAYTSIVGSGVNSAILHYSANARQVQNGDLVLVDAGGEYEGYGTDITRTFPANGTFTAPQREIYQIVLDAQKAAIDAIKPGVSFTNLTSIALHTMAQGLLKASYSARQGLMSRALTFRICTGRLRVR